MENVEIIFEFNGEKIKIQGNRNDYMKDLTNKFLQKMNLDSNKIYFLYQGDMINKEKTLKEINNKDNNKDNIISIIAKEYDTTIIEENKCQTNYINCPTCNDNYFIEISNYNIKTKCKRCGNKENILLNQFKESITSNVPNIQCQNCNKSRNKIYDNLLYECLDCQIHLCPLCIQKHKNSEHKCTNYDFKNNFCDKHKEMYRAFCQNCEKSLCSLCYIEHDRAHKIILLKDILFDDNNLNDYLNKIRSNINNLKNYIDNLNAKLEKILNGFEIYYYLYEILIKNYNKENISYQNIMNIISFNNFNKEIINDINYIIKQKDFNKYLDSLYQKITKENSNNVEEKNIIDESNQQNQEMINLQTEGNELNDLSKFIKDNPGYCLKNLDSLIITNFVQNLSLKNWINSNSNIQVNLLYRLSRDGPEISTFHNLCDNKGPTLTLFHTEDGDKIGFYINESFDSTSSWKYDSNCFIFNLNQNKKFMKIKRYYLFDYPSFCCLSNCGPSVNGLGCNENNSLNSIFYSYANIVKCFENCSEFLPNSSEEKEYKVKETEIFQVIIE